MPLRSGQTEIIFASLPGYLDFAARFLAWRGCRVHYVALASSGASPQAEQLRAQSLELAGVGALPLADCEELRGVLRYHADRLQMEKVGRCAPAAVLRAFAPRFSKVTDIERKLPIVVQTAVAEYLAMANTVNLWVESHPSQRPWLIDPRAMGLLAPELMPGVRRLVVPIDEVIGSVARVVRAALRAAMGRLTTSPAAPIAGPPAAGSEDFSESSVVIVTHQGLSYGELFTKTLLYSDDSGSERHRDKVLHFDYSGFPGPGGGIKWVCLRDRPGSVIQAAQAALAALAAAARGLIRVRRLEHLVGVLVLVRAYAGFRRFSKALEKYPALKVALIDYDILCPKSLLLALESRGVVTVAAQERFLMPFYLTLGTILNTYLCGSEAMSETIRRSPVYSVARCLPVGQYRADHLVRFRQLPPPQVLAAPLAKGKKILVALGFHTHLQRHHSLPDPVLNWPAHSHFLRDMIQVARELPEAFVVLRYKDLDWVTLPAFAACLREIERMDNITISTDYSRPLVSYDLCAHAHLVIAKHTSLADECLAAGVPVLFHEYSHNARRLVADAFDYRPTRVMCFSHEELIERALVVLGAGAETDDTMQREYDHLRRVLYGGLGDGHVHQRIHAHLDAVLV